LRTLDAYANEDGAWYMDDDESESKFDSLASVDTMTIHNNLLSRIPSLKNCGKLRLLWMSSCRITEIGRDAFRGATQLLTLRLGGNRITSVAHGAFAALNAMQVPVGEFAPTNTDGTGPYLDIFGVGACPKQSPFDFRCRCSCGDPLGCGCARIRCRDSPKGPPT